MSVSNKTTKFGSDFPEKFTAWANKPTIVFGVWILLFAMTVFFSELSVRALISAFIAWIGGLISAHLNTVLKRERIYKDISQRIAKNRKYNKNVY